MIEGEERGERACHTRHIPITVKGEGRREREEEGREGGGGRSRNHPLPPNGTWNQSSSSCQKPHPSLKENRRIKGRSGGWTTRRPPSQVGKSQGKEVCRRNEMRRGSLTAFFRMTTIDSFLTANT